MGQPGGRAGANLPGTLIHTCPTLLPRPQEARREVERRQAALRAECDRAVQGEVARAEKKAQALRAQLDEQVCEGGS